MLVVFPEAAQWRLKSHLKLLTFFISCLRFCLQLSTTYIRTAVFLFSTSVQSLLTNLRPILLAVYSKKLIRFGLGLMDSQWTNTWRNRWASMETSAIARSHSKRLVVRWRSPDASFFRPLGSMMIRTPMHRTRSVQHMRTSTSSFIARSGSGRRSSFCDVFNAIPYALKGLIVISKASAFVSRHYCITVIVYLYTKPFQLFQWNGNNGVSRKQRHNPNTHCAQRKKNEENYKN